MDVVVAPIQYRMEFPLIRPASGNDFDLGGRQLYHQHPRAAAKPDVQRRAGRRGYASHAATGPLARQNEHSKRASGHCGPAPSFSVSRCRTMPAHSEPGEWATQVSHIEAPQLGANLKSPHWRRWLGPEHRCLVPVTASLTVPFSRQGDAGHIEKPAGCSVLSGRAKNVSQS